MAPMVLVIIAGDALWLGVIARGLYQKGIGHLMADQPNFIAAAVFYLLYPVGIMAFCVTPNASSEGWAATLMSAALFGFIAYATYDLSNLATLRDWPLQVALVDMVWGTLD